MMVYPLVESAVVEIAQIMSEIQTDPDNDGVAFAITENH